MRRFMVLWKQCSVILCSHNFFPSLHDSSFALSPDASREHVFRTTVSMCIKITNQRLIRGSGTAVDVGSFAQKAS